MDFEVYKVTPVTLKMLRLKARKIECCHYSKTTQSDSDSDMAALIVIAVKATAVQ